MLELALLNLALFVLLAWLPSRKGRRPEEGRRRAKALLRSCPPRADGREAPRAGSPAWRSPLLVATGAVAAGMLLALDHAGPVPGPWGPAEGASSLAPGAEPESTPACSLALPDGAVVPGPVDGLLRVRLEVAGDTPPLTVLHHI